MGTLGLVAALRSSISDKEQVAGSLKKGTGRSVQGDRKVCAAEASSSSWGVHHGAGCAEEGQMGMQPQLRHLVAGSPAGAWNCVCCWYSVASLTRPLPHF